MMHTVQKYPNQVQSIVLDKTAAKLSHLKCFQESKNKYYTMTLIIKQLNMLQQQTITLTAVN